MIEKYVPCDHQNDNFYERFTEERTRDLNSPSTTEEHDSCPFPIEPLPSISSNLQKRLSTHSNDSRITSPLASSRTPVLSPAVPMQTSTPIHLLHSTHKLLNRRPGNISVRFNKLFVKMPPAWLKIASNCAPTSLNVIARNQITPILSQYREQSPGRAIHFDPFSKTPTFL